MLLILLSVLITLAFILLIVLFIYSPGKSDPFLDDNGKPLANSISEKVFVNIGGIKQGIFIKSKNQGNPVLLYLHGGIPDYFLTRKYPTGLEDYFTVVWWEQRGFGLLYNDSIPYGYLKLRDQAMHSLGIGTTRDMNSIITGLFIPSLTCKEYTLKEKFNLWRGKSQSGVHPLWDEMIATDLIKQVNEVNIPVYFFHGIYDYTVSYPLAMKYLEEIHAPVKGFYTFENSAHSPLFEEPEKVVRILLTDIVNGTNNLADNK